MASPELLAAVTAAVKGETPPAAPPDPPAGDPPAGDPPAGDPPSGAADDLIGKPPGDLVGDPPAGDPPAPAPGADGRVRGPDGKFIAAAPKAGDPPAPAVPPAGAPPVAAAPVPSKPPADPVNDPIPPNAKPETRERIQTLVDKVKSTDAELSTVRSDFELVMGPINEAGATPEQFRESMTLLKNINSPHQHEQMQALQFLQAVVGDLSQRLGQVPPGTDPLAGHADLLQAVQANQMPRQYAEEVARSRRLTAATQQHQQVTQQRSQQSQAQTQRVQQGQASVRAVELSFANLDPQYAAKIAIMQADTAYMSQLRAMPPEQWAAEFSKKYNSVKVAPAPAPAPAPGTPPAGGPQPLRPKQPAGNTGKPPGTLLEAVRGAINERRVG